MRIDLNADVGEGFGPWQAGDDAAIMPHLTSANIACGGHAGDPGTMRETVRLAREHGVGPGAHPSFPDLQGFGRREMRLSPREVEDLVAAQVGALAGVAAVEGVRLRHVKPHGALYNMAARERALADAIARAVRGVDPALALVGLSGSELAQAAERAGVRAVYEGFADRGYRPDGSLVPRGEPGAVIADASVVADRAVLLATRGVVTASDGSALTLRVDSICLHGDTPGAVDLARAIRQALEQAGVELRAPGD